MRIEDTDKERSKPEYEDNIKEGLAWLGLSFDEEYRQSERTDIYREQLQRLIDTGHAYISKEPPKEEGGRTEVIRFRNPNKKVAFDDVIRGRIEIDTTDLGDFVIAKDMETPLYNFAVVVDDMVMGVTHIIRGEDGISNTPRQILMWEAFGAPLPTYAHIPLILAPDRSKLSKRNGAVSLLEYRDQGYLPDAVNNFLALIGWNPGDEREIFTMDELIAAFSLERIQKSGAIFNQEKLAWLNREHLKRLPEEFVIEQIMERLGVSDRAMAARIAPLVLERITTFGDLEEMRNSGEFAYFFAKPIYESSALYWKNERDTGALDSRLQEIAKIISQIDAAVYTAETIKEAVWPYAEKEGRGSVLWPFRVALSGREKSPDPFELASILGKQETIARINEAIEKLAH